MATAEEYAAWIVKNADKKGTPDFEKVAAAYKQVRAQEQEGSSPEITYTYPREGSGQPVVQVADQVPAPRNYSLGEVPGAMIRNAPASGLKVIGDVVTAVTSPVQTATAIGDLVGGVMEPITPNILFGGDSRERAIAARSNFADYMSERFGGYEELKRTMAEDPIGFLGDLSTVLSGGAGMAKLAGKGSRAITKTADVGQLEGALVKGFDTAAKYTNPLTPIAAGGADGVVCFWLHAASRFLLIWGAFERKTALANPRGVALRMLARSSLGGHS
jgi:hypothetical protein